MEDTMMSAVMEETARPVSPVTMTVGLLRELLTHLELDTAIHVGIYDPCRFNALIGTVPVTAARITPSAADPQRLLLRVPGIS